MNWLLRYIKSRVAIAFSGGATKIAFMAGALLCLISLGIIPVGFIGTSSGGILAFFSALGRYDLIKKYMPIYTLELIFGKNISKFYNQVIGVFSLFRKGSMYEYKGLEKLIRDLISEEEFIEYQQKKGSPFCYIHIADDKSLVEKHVDLKKVSYQEAVKSVIASCSIPIFVPRVKIFNSRWYDGGVMKHIASEWLVVNHSNEFDKLISIYSRSNNIKDYVTYKFISNPIKNIERQLLIKNILNSFDNRQDTDIACKNKGIEHVCFFAPNKLQESTFDTSKEGNIEMFEKGKRAVKTRLDD